RVRRHNRTTDEHPRGSRVIVVTIPPHYGGVPIRGQRDGESLLRSAHRARADQLGALLAPHAATARVHPRGSRGIVVTIPTHDGGAPVPGQRDGACALVGRPHRAHAHHLGLPPRAHAAPAHLHPHG